MLEKKDLRHIKWETGVNSVGRAVRQYHASVNENGKKYYYKLSYFKEEKGIFIGHESLNEVIVSRLLDMLEIEHAVYEPVYADITLSGKEYSVLLCRSEDFTREGESRISIDEYYSLNRHHYETPMEFCARMGIIDNIYRMIAVDYLIMNRDRYGYNIEILFDSNGSIRMAPLFDHGLSLLCNCKGDKEMAAFDVMKDEFSLMFIGSWLVTKNLELIPKEKRDSLIPFEKIELSRLFDGVGDFMTPIHREKVIEMLSKRMEYFRDQTS